MCGCECVCVCVQKSASIELSFKLKKSPECIDTNTITYTQPQCFFAIQAHATAYTLTIKIEFVFVQPQDVFVKIDVSKIGLNSDIICNEFFHPTLLQGFFYPKLNSLEIYSRASSNRNKILIIFKRVGQIPLSRGNSIKFWWLFICQTKVSFNRNCVG